MFKRTKRFLKAATSFSYVKESAVFVYNLSRSIFKIPVKNQKDVCVDLDDGDIAEDKIKNAKKAFTTLFWVYSILFVGVFCYAIKLLLFRDIMGGIVGLSSSCVLLAFVFKYHFWLTQIKKKKLGVTVKEWLYCLLGK